MIVFSLSCSAVGGGQLQRLTRGQVSLLYAWHDHAGRMPEQDSLWMTLAAMGREWQEAGWSVVKCKGVEVPRT